ncbi:DMT family transporter [Spongiivirga sp. MCCC 1A20706]|uniref:DMT family transporter n=1 Tax=Spongiivirga sp. MCCC 1A20706 TaxID=3160963 RepID=UPI00397796FB
MSKRTLAILAALGANLIYAINHTVAKDVMPTHIKPFGFILLRVLGASFLFWLISIWAPKEKIDKKDWLRIMGGAFFGMCLNMLAFFKGLSLSTPIQSSIVITITPIVVFILSAYLIKEKIKGLRWFGIFMGFAGALTLIIFGQELRMDAPNIPFGNSLFVVNAIAYAFYLVIVKPLTAKYHVFTLMKWLFLFGLIMNIPVTISEFLEVQWSSLPFDASWRMAFVVLGTTFTTYLLNVYALTNLRASTIGAFVYLQPLMAIAFAIIVGADSLNVVKIIAACTVLIGVYLVTKKPKEG